MTLSYHPYDEEGKERARGIAKDLNEYIRPEEKQERMESGRWPQDVRKMVRDNTKPDTYLSEHYGLETATELVIQELDNLN